MPAADKARFIDLLGLRELADRRSSLEAAEPLRPKADVRQDLGLLPDGDCLDELDSDQPLRLLRIVETGAGGMFGDWHLGDSKLHKALCSFGITDKTDGSGGSFGYGKAGLIRGSKIRTVIAYTCFGEQLELESTEEDAPLREVSRRLLGSVYWGEHRFGDRKFLGDARLGSRRNPLDNDDADRMARSLCLRERSKENAADFGTSLVLIDPTVEPDDLRRTAERYWWPALEDKELAFEIEIVGYDGHPHRPQPKLRDEGADDDLAAFISTYAVATEPTAVPQDHHQWTIASQAVPGHEGSNTPVGRLSLAHDRSSWSYPSGRDDDTKDASLIALVRDPRMVVTYLKFAEDSPPYVRGTFVAFPSANRLLWLTEPPEHDTWRTKGYDGDQPTAHHRVAKSILDGIERQVRKLRTEISPPPTTRAALPFPAFDQIAKLLRAGGSGKGHQKARPRPLRIIPGDELRYTDQGYRQVVGSAEIGYSRDPEATRELPDAIQIRVAIRHRWERFDNAGERSNATVVVQPPGGFVRSDTPQEAYEGLLTRHEPILVDYMTEEYIQPWTGTIEVIAEVIGPAILDGERSAF